MNRTRFSSNEIADIVMKLIGEIEPVGETYTDEKRFANLLTVENTVDILLDEIRFASESKNRVEYSMQKIGRNANDYLLEKYNQLKEMFEDE